MFFQKTNYENITCIENSQLLCAYRRLRQEKFFNFLVVIYKKKGKIMTKKKPKKGYMQNCDKISYSQSDIGKLCIKAVDVAKAIKS